MSGNGRVVVGALLAYFIPLAVNAVASFVTDWTGVGVWLISPIAGAVAAVLVALTQKASEAPPPPRGRPDLGNRYSRPTVTGAGLLTVLLVVGVVGVGLALGVRFAVGWFSGDESGEEVLVERVEGASGGVTAAVESVEHTSHFTRVEIVVTNNGAASVSLPLFGYCVLVGDDGTTLEPDSFKSDWSDTIPPGGRQRGTVVFPGHLPDGVTSASLSFTTVFGPGGGDALTVSNIRLTPPSALATASPERPLTSRPPDRGPQPETGPGNDEDS
jgi:hypothetical protein